jgi:hypothetical protein
MVSNLIIHFSSMRTYSYKLEIGIMGLICIYILYLDATSFQSIDASLLLESQIKHNVHIFYTCSNFESKIRNANLIVTRYY